MAQRDPKPTPTFGEEYLTYLGDIMQITFGTLDRAVKRLPNGTWHNPWSCHWDVTKNRRFAVLTFCRDNPPDDHHYEITMNIPMVHFLHRRFSTVVAKLAKLAHSRWQDGMVAKHVRELKES
jgi:hypothetical protein